MTPHEQLMSLAFASVISPALFVCEHVEQKYGRLHLSDLEALGDDERKAIEEAMPIEFMVRVANRLDMEWRNRIAEMLGPEKLAKVHEVIARQSSSGGCVNHQGVARQGGAFFLSGESA